MQMRWHVAQNDADWLVQALVMINEEEQKAILTRGVFHLVIAGGGTPQRLYQALAGQPHDWTRWQVWFGDERCLPSGDPERNSTMAESAWLKRVGIPDSNIHPIQAELGAAAAAEDYARQLDGVGSFDMVLLGLGEDGHTASLFPGHGWGTERSSPSVLPVYNAPKPPSERVSLSAWRLGMADKVLFLVQGAGKRAAISEWRQGRAIPAAAISTANGVDVLLDRSANGE